MRIIEESHRSISLSTVEIVRAVLGAAVGYVVLACATLLFFTLIGRVSPGHDNGMRWLLAAGISALFAAFAGYLCVAVAGRVALLPMIALVALLGISGAIAMEARLGAEFAWPQRAMFLLFAAAAFLGGAVRRHQTRDFQTHHDRP